MVIPFIPRFCFLGSFVLAGIGLSSETTSSFADETQPPTRLLSPHLQNVLSASLPKYDPVKSVPDKHAKRSGSLKTSDADGDVLVLPSFIVRDPRPPTTDELLSPSGKLDRYLGSKDGFDRGFLNRVQLMDNQKRVKTMRQDELRLRNREELLEMASMLKTAGDLEGSKQIIRESNTLFLRKSGFKRSRYDQ